ncbi:Dual-specificity RNA pseudouridine synthase RluA (23S rRNA pseudouridine(746) synthase) (Ribosomal large subunit pseudouridine synthase A) (rRNA pseudouridylate synthase A) (rRNA-uridine isomerase A) (tRNA pseudouridine(32) synthase) [Durusdinium trenchii]|uniref:Pseudouridine synthase RsuA/RluA-like domain-containing protein n=1 Tax=Durusdinium trenchii TaxID=1381693 RepID=A0ABP0QIR7_9DINO
MFVMKIRRNEVTYNSGIGALDGTQEWQIAVHLLEQMALEVLPGVVSYQTAMSVCGKASVWAKAILLLDSVTKSAQDMPATWTAAISACSSGSQWQAALHLGAQMPKEDFGCCKSYGAVMTACAQQNRWHFVIALFSEMLSLKFPPDCSHFQTAISACRSWEWMLNLLEKSREQSLELGFDTYNIVLMTLRKSGKWDIALASLETIAYPDATHYANVILAMGEASEWRQSLAMMNGHQLDVRTANSAISACERGSQWKQVVGVLQHMHTHHIEMDATTVSAAADACPSWQLAISLLNLAMHDSVQLSIESFNAALNLCQDSWRTALSILVWLSAGISLDHISCGSFLSSCEKAGEWRVALQVFWELPSRSSQCFDILNRVLVGAAHWQLTLQLMSQMLEQRLMPNGMHVASAAQALKMPGMSARLLQDSLGLWKANAPEVFIWNSNLKMTLAEAGCHREVLASRPGILAMSKPPNMTTEAILEELTDRVSSRDPELACFTSVSRLDFPTSGVLIVAHGPPESPAANWLQAQFASRLVKKEYLCLVEGKSLGEVGSQGEIVQPLLTISSNRGSRVEASSLGQEAQTKYEVLQRFPLNGTSMELIFLRVAPLTGRMHQIRVHFSSIGRPLVGDLTYNQFSQANLSPRLFLHCHQMELQDLELKPFAVKQSLPGDLQMVLDNLHKK